VLAPLAFKVADPPIQILLLAGTLLIETVGKGFTVTSTLCVAEQPVAVFIPLKV
jgi:hypothetical protein